MLGIDICKETLACVLLEPGSRQARWQKSVPNTRAGITGLLHQTPPEIPLVLEPTGRFGQLVVQQAHAAGRLVLLAPPRQAKAFLSSVQSRAKTDTLDARGLALFALWRALRPYPLKSEAVEKLDQLLSARKGISTSMARLKQQRAVLPHAREALAAAIGALQEQQAFLDKQIAQHSQTRPEFEAVQRLLAVPGIGPVTASTLVSRLACKQFSHPDAFVAYRPEGTRPGRRGSAVGQEEGRARSEPSRRRGTATPVVAVCAGQSALHKQSLQGPVCTGARQGSVLDRGAVRGSAQASQAVLVAAPARNGV